MRRSVSALLAVGATLGLGATALAQGGEDSLAIDLQDGCLNASRVSLEISPPSDGTVTSLTVRANGREVLDLTGLTGTARLTVRLASDRGRVTVSGELASGQTFDRSRDYRPCAPRPAPTQAPQRSTRPEPTLSGGGEG